MDSIKFAPSLLEQRLERAFRLGPFLDQVEEIIDSPLSEEEGSSDSEERLREYMKNGLKKTKLESRESRALMYNFSLVKEKREWLKEVLLSSSSSSESDRELDETDLKHMLWEHKLRKKYQREYYQKEKSSDFMYYGSGLLSRTDHFPERQKRLEGLSKKKKKISDSRRKEKKLKVIENDVVNSETECQTGLNIVKEENLSDYLEDSPGDISVATVKPKKKSQKKHKKDKKRDIQVLTMKRQKLWVSMAKKELSKCQKSRIAFRKEMLQSCKKMATGCMRHCRQKALQSQKQMKDKVWHLKRLTRTMQAEWKKYDRLIREQNKRAEKEAEEQRKIDREIMEVKRQQRKVNFLITLPELYAHFMKNKMESGSGTIAPGADEGAKSILMQLDEGHQNQPSAIDDYDCESMKEQALKTAQDAYSSHFGGGTCPHSKRSTSSDHHQPKSFVGQLKSYQLKGLNWLANLYYFGINGILADEMGLGKTVQSIAFLAHIAEEYDTWGPFLIVTPASTLHNWSFELSRFVPDFKVVPYWGNPEERRNLRKFFDGRGIGTKESSFHVVVTSYQIVIQDFKFLNRLKWNYMILDEAQAIKSINSQRWKQLLGFSCRNRLLLSGTPIQNSMVELWALLHFIMPSLFDSHSWFNEWFSRDIEGHIENKTTVDEKHLNRLHMILKPFMLRRIKVEVENELSDKIEIMMYCPLTLRQQSLYDGLKNKIVIDELLGSSTNSSSFQSVTTSLLNLVMQFRKVCNHPELLERREVRSPFTLAPEPFALPKLIFREGVLRNCVISAKDHLLYNHLSIFHSAYVYSRLKNCQEIVCCFSFLPFIGLSISEFSQLFLGGYWVRYCHLFSTSRNSLLFYLLSAFRESKYCRWFNPRFLLLNLCLSRGEIITSSFLSSAIFTSFFSFIYAFTDHVFHSLPETSGHRLMRVRKLNNRIFIQDHNIDSDSKELLQVESSSSPMRQALFPLRSEELPSKYQLRSPRKKSPMGGVCDRVGGIKMEVGYHDPRLGEFPFVQRIPIIRRCQPTYVPNFLLHTCPRVKSLPREMYAVDRSAAYASYSTVLNTLNHLHSSFMHGSSEMKKMWQTRHSEFCFAEVGGLNAILPPLGWNKIIIPDKHTLMMDSGKLYVLDALLERLKMGNHRVLVYSQMTKMIDILEEYMWHKKHKYMRLDGSSKISDRRDMVEDFQNKSDIFVFLLSTRAGGVGINLTAADTVIFYDSDWNPTVDQQAMDRAHRLGQTKQVTVYRLICKGTIEERILQRAQEKSEIQRMVISGGSLKPDTLKPKEVVSLLLDADIEKEFRAKQAERKLYEDQKLEVNRGKMRKRYLEKRLERESKRLKKTDYDDNGDVDVCGEGVPFSFHSETPSPALSEDSFGTDINTDRTESLTPISKSRSTTSPSFSFLGQGVDARMHVSPNSGRRVRKRGRPRGSSSRGHSHRRSQSSLNSITTSAGTQTCPFESGGESVNEDISGSSSTSGVQPKRGRGRPRLLSLGPGNQGSRTSSSLSVALGSTLGSSLGSSDKGRSSSYDTKKMS